MPEVKVLLIFVSSVHQRFVKTEKNMLNIWRSKTDRIIYAKLDKLQIALEVEDKKDDNYSEYSDSLKRRKMNRRFIQVVFQFILFFQFRNFTIIQILSLGSLP